MKRYTLLLLTLLTASAVSAQSLLWKVSGNGLREPSYLFGTYHVLKDSYLNSNPKVRDAYRKAQGVVVETTIDSSAAMMQMAMKALMLDNSLTKLLSDEDYALVSKEFQRATGMDLAMFNQLKPAIASMMLSMADLEKGTDTLKRFTGQPIDLFFAADGKKLGKNVSTLETMDEQLSLLLDHEPVEKQAKQLVQMVREKDKMRGVGKQITDLYFKQDLQAMYKLSQDLGESYGDMTYLTDERNRTWMKKLPALVSSRPTFIAVGALHLPGPQGLIELFRKEGYKVEPL
ncbi:TraB/GumN family protein [Tellurirhabdus rosea]|uniref:TraB/GumN family protein n=1 Tax=Tellurirhabdus rosea TaxID=2674997 RepID=UPI00224D2180|nr:TraB/GumN family protein [Tellurirhabdus rosea]